MSRKSDDTDQKKIDFALLDLLVERHPKLDEKAILELYHQRVKNKQQTTIELLTGQVTDQTKQLLDSAILDTVPSEATSKASYRIDRRLDSGGQSDVFLAHRDDGTFEKTVVIKRSHHAIKNTSDQLRMLGEMQILADLKHPNVVSILDAGIDETQHPWMILEYIEGTHIDQFIQQKKISQSAVIELCIDIAQALNYVHQQSIYHLDIKPSNVLVEILDDKYRPVLIDFGIAKGPRKAAYLDKNQMMATPAYAAPEQLDLTQGHVDQRTDIYAFGQLMHRLISCRVSDSQISGFDADFKAIIDCCSQTQPDQRYPDMASLLEDLQCYQLGLPVSVRPLTLSQRWLKKIKNHPTQFAVGALLILLISGLTGYGLNQRFSAEKKADTQTATNQYYWRQAEAIRSDATLLYARPTQNIEQAYQKLHQRYDQQMNELASEKEDIDRLPMAQAAISLNRFEEAQDHLMAVQKYRDDPQVLLLLAQNHFNLYQKHEKTVRQGTNPEDQRLQLQALREKWINPAIQYLQSAQDQSAVEDPVISSLLLYYKGQTRAALQPLAEAQEKHMWPIEQLSMSAQILKDEAQQQLLDGDKEAAKSSMNQSMSMLRQAHTIARSHPLVLKQWCQAEGLSATIDLVLADAHQEGCQKLLILLPNSEEAIVLSAQTIGLKAREMLKQGNDPLPLIEAAQSLLKKADGVDSSEKFHILGILSSIEADWLTFSNSTGQEASLKAIEYYRLAAQKQNGSYQIQFNLADALYAFASLNYNEFENSEAFFNEAENLYQTLIQHPQSNVFVRAKLVHALTDHAYRRFQSSLKADTQLQQAEIVLRDLHQQWPDNSNAYTASANLYWTYAYYQFIQGYDLEPHFTQAMSYFQKDLSLNPDQWTKRYNFISLMLAGAMSGLEQGQGRKQLLDSIGAELQTLALQISDSVNLSSHLGYYKNLQAMQAVIDNHTPSEYLAKARSYNISTLDSSIDRYAGLTQLATTFMLQLNHTPNEIDLEDRNLLIQGLTDYPEHHRLRAQYAHILFLLSKSAGEHKNIEKMQLLKESQEQLQKALTGNPLLVNRYDSMQQRVSHLITQNHLQK